ncbi:hypothetical protein [Streptomyces spinosisporus]|jgi:hypothetical protein|uniref:Uncharacterized protein n=1 Tax=Streptomyces spinosisporus TaxID=2927582 RepID=A0ABS9X824_9ACTN|nr:hypothetical protein [Streptomyces spinosisporus]MCI3238214.1 hypothetical protein [Streptomyces spinosisporus]
MSDTEFVQRVTSSRKPGPKRDPLRAELREMFPEWSDRTFATYWKGMTAHLDLVARGLITAAYMHELQATAIDRATKPNGAFSVVGYAKACENGAADILAKFGGAS